METILLSRVYVQKQAWRTGQILVCLYVWASPFSLWNHLLSIHRIPTQGSQISVLRCRGREKTEGWLWDGNATPTAALAPVHTPPWAKCTAASCEQPLLWINTTQPPPSAIWSPGWLSAFWFSAASKAWHFKIISQQNILQDLDPILPQKNTYLPAWHGAC